MRRRTWIALTLAGILVAVPVGGELLARSVLRDRVRAAASRALDGDLDIALASRPALLQLADKRLPFVEVDSAHTRLGRVPDAQVHARLDDVHFTGGDPGRATMAAARVTVLIPPSAVAGMVRDVGGMPVAGVRTDPRTDTMTLLMGQAGLGSVTLRPEIKDGRVRTTVTSVEIMGRTAPDAMTDRIRHAVEGRAEPQAYPVGLEATSARVEDDGIHVRLATDSPATLPRTG
ncbi:LmeA family phospholipid-binding protein [Streptomyces sp. NPDC001530]|uniref:LmeA family phospholipid-binding protein n=1 Tax=Streptomyces sp. NPDC001530 TaxID=3364582 RepID=UPI0036B186C0